MSTRALWWLLLPLAATCRAETVYFFNDYETRADCSLRGTNGKCQVDFLGLSQERTLSGSHSLKIDVTLNSGTWCYFHVPVNVELTPGAEYYLSGYFLPQQLPSGTTVSLGWSCQHVGDRKTVQGNSPIAPMADQAHGIWEQRQIEVRSAAEESGRRLMQEHDGGKLQKLAMDYAYVHIGGSFSGQRVVLYLDDLRLCSERRDGLVREEDTDGDGLLEPVLENSRFRLVVDPRHGGRGSHWIDKTSGKEMISWTVPKDVHGGVIQDIFDHYAYPGDNAMAPYAYHVERSTAEEGVVKLWYRFEGADLAGLVSEKTVRIRRESPVVSVSWRIRNLSDESKLLSVRVHNCLKPTGTLGQGDHFLTPRREGVKALPIIFGGPSNDIRIFDGTHGWHAIMNRPGKTAVVALLDVACLSQYYYWFASEETCSFEWFYDTDFVRPGKEWRTDFCYILAHGLSDLSHVTRDYAASLTPIVTDRTVGLALSLLPVERRLEGIVADLAVVSVNREHELVRRRVSFGTVDAQQPKTIKETWSAPVEGTFVVKCTVSDNKGRLGEFEVPFDVGRPSGKYVARAPAKTKRDVKRELEQALREERRARAEALLRELKVDLKGRDYLVYAKTPFEPALYDTVLRRDELLSKLSLMAAPGQYAPTTFSVWAKADLHSVRVDVTELSGTPGVISRSELDLRVVKCWEQRVTSERSAVVPELLMYDDTVKLKGIVPEGGEVSDPPRRPLVTDIPAFTSKQFWLTVHVAEGAKPGEYKGTIAIAPRGSAQALVSVELRVMPIKLLKPSNKKWGTCFPLSCYWPGYDFAKTPLYFKDHVAHGFDFTRAQHRGDMSELRQILRWYVEAGLGDPWIDVGTGAHPDKIRQVMDIGKNLGLREWWFFTIDEPHTPEQLAETKRLLAVIKTVTGAKTYVPGWTGLRQLEPLLDERDYGMGYSYSQDIEEEARRIPIGFYNNDVSEGEKSPLTRVVAGLWFYATPFARFCPWAYLAGMGKDPFDDFDSGGKLGAWWRDCMCVYPTKEGPMPTQHWEAMRAGVDDVRYLYTLEQAIARARPRASGDDKLRAEVAKAESLVSEILSQIDSRDAAKTAARLTPRVLQQIRRRLAEQLARLQ